MNANRIFNSLELSKWSTQDPTNYHFWAAAFRVVFRLALNFSYSEIVKLVEQIIRIIHNCNSIQFQAFQTSAGDVDNFVSCQQKIDRCNCEKPRLSLDWLVDILSSLWELLFIVKWLRVCNHCVWNTDLYPLDSDFIL